MKKKLDFTGVETFQRAPEGQHIAKISKIDETTFQGGNEGFKITFEIVKGVGKGCRVIENFPFVDTALWKLKNLLESIGLKVNGRVMIDTDKLIGKMVEITVAHEEYEGRTRAKISEINKILNTSEDDEDSDEPDEDDEDDEAEELDDEDEEEAPKRSQKIASKAKEKSKNDKSTKTDKKSAKKAKSEPEEDEDDDWSDDDDWDEEE